MSRELITQMLGALDNGAMLDDGSIDTDYLDAITAARKYLSKDSQESEALAAPEQSEQAEWMPIDTAPKGRILLVHYKNNLGNGRTMRARFYLPDTLDSDTTESGWADEGWYEESEAYEYLMPLDGEPTHWMPLPQEPGRYTHPAPKAETESAYQRGYLDGMAKPCTDCADYRAMYLKVRDELSALQQAQKKIPE